MTALFDFVAAHRIASSRFFGIVFFAVVLITESAHEGTVLSSILFLLGLLLVGIATIGRLWCSLYISGYKNTQLITTGPYSVSRNPLYFFSMVGFAGIGLSTETVSLAIVILLAALMFYPTVIAREERYLRAKFPSEFEAYAAHVPKLIPCFATFSEPQQYSVNPVLFRRTMGDVIWFVALVGVIEFVEALHEYHVVEPLIYLP